MLSVRLSVQDFPLGWKISLVSVTLRKEGRLFVCILCVVGSRVIIRRLSGAHCSDRCEGSQREVWDKRENWDTGKRGLISSYSFLCLSAIFRPLSPCLICSCSLLITWPLLHTFSTLHSLHLRCREGGSGGATLASCLPPIFGSRGDSGICGMLPSCWQLWLWEATALFQTR